MYGKSSGLAVVADTLWFVGGFPARRTTKGSSEVHYYKKGSAGQMTRGPSYPTIVFNS